LIMATRTGNPGPAPEPSVQATSAALLTELRAAHAALLDSIAELEKACALPVPGEAPFTAIRWTLSGASLTRRMLWAKILGFLVPLVAQGEEEADRAAAADLRRLQEGDIALLRASTAHVGRWSAENALADWAAYCEASRIMRGRMEAAIEEERRVLYPMLERLGRKDAAGSQ
jgi:hypothetical protein